MKKYIYIYPTYTDTKHQKDTILDFSNSFPENPYSTVFFELLRRDLNRSQRSVLLGDWSRIRDWGYRIGGRWRCDEDGVEAVLSYDRRRRRFPRSRHGGLNSRVRVQLSRWHWWERESGRKGWFKLAEYFCGTYFWFTHLLTNTWMVGSDSAWAPRLVWIGVRSATVGVGICILLQWEIFQSNYKNSERK